MAVGPKAPPAAVGKFTALLLIEGDCFFFCVAMPASPTPTVVRDKVLIGIGGANASSCKVIAAGGERSEIVFRPPRLGDARFADEPDDEAAEKM